MDRAAHARQIKAQRAQTNIEAKQKQAENLMKNKLAYEHAQNQQLRDTISDLQAEIESLRQQQDNMANIILQDLMNHIQNQNDYCPETYSLAMNIQSISPKAYSLLVEKLNFPKESTIRDKVNEIIGKFPEDLKDINCLHKITNTYKEKSNISKSAVIDACLAVDAICFTPDVKITNDSEVYGIDLNEEFDFYKEHKIYKSLSEDIGRLETFIKLNWEKVIKSAFVFQVQPYDIRLKPFVIHVFPTPNGKGSDIIISLLDKIRQDLKKWRINIRSFAFDGDNSYLELHRAFYESYIHKAIETERINYYKTNLRIVSDYLHILKRLRYRLLSCIIHTGFTTDSPSILIEDLQNILPELPSVVWSNELITKMHDSLPIKLFSVSNLFALIENGHLPGVAFYFPIVSSLIAIHNEDIGFKNRLFLLETAFWFLVFYKDALDNADEENEQLRQRKYRENNHVTFYTNELLMEFTNTLLSHIQLMNVVDNYNFDRNSTTPLEHKFGIGRLRSRDAFTLQKFLRVISSFQVIEQKDAVLNQLQQEEELIKIAKRTNSFGVQCEKQDEDELIYDAFADEEDEEALNFRYSAQTCAKAVLLMAGFDVSYTNRISIDEVLDWLYSYLMVFLPDNSDKEDQKKPISSSNITLGVKKCNSRLDRIQNANESSKITRDQRRVNALHDVLADHFGRTPTKSDLSIVLKHIKEADPQGPKPPINGKKDQMIDFLKENIVLYYPIL